MTLRALLAGGAPPTRAPAPADQALPPPPHLPRLPSLAVHHPYDRYSMVDLEAPDLGLWPKSTRPSGVVALLQPGDLLFVPAYW